MAAKDPSRSRPGAPLTGEQSRLNFCRELQARDTKAVSGKVWRDRLRGDGVAWALRRERCRGPIRRPYSADLRERALLACEEDRCGFAAVARRFRIGVSTLRLWRRQAREEGRRTPLRMGRGPAPLGGGAALLNRLVAERCLFPPQQRFAPRRLTAPALPRGFQPRGARPA